MIDVTAWNQRAKAFLRRLANLPGRIEIDDRIEPPATSEYDREWLDSHRCSLPPEIRRFNSLGSMRCLFRYRWTPPAALRREFQEFFPGRDEIHGGADFCEKAKYSMFGSRDKSGADFGALSLMFHGATEPYLNGGQLLVLASNADDQTLALQASAVESDRQVVCVEAAGNRPPARVSMSFEQFLVDWESICYLTPNLDTLRPWLNTETGILSPDPKKVRRLRALFSPAALSNEYEDRPP